MSSGKGNARLLLTRARDTNLLELISEAVKVYGDSVFELTTASTEIWNRIGETMRSNGWTPSAISWRKQWTMRVKNLKTKKRDCVRRGERWNPDEHERTIEQLREVQDRYFRRRDDDFLEFAIAVEGRWNEYRSASLLEKRAIGKEIYASLSDDNLMRLQSFGVLIKNSINETMNRYKTCISGKKSRKLLSEGERIFLRLQGITPPPEFFSSETSSVDSEHKLEARRPLQPIDNSLSIRNDEGKDEANVAGPSSIARKRSVSSKRRQKASENPNQPTETAEESAKRQREQEDARILAETEAKFGKRPPYGTREYFEWMGLLYGMPPTGSVPVLVDSSSDEEELEEDEDETEVQPAVMPSHSHTDVMPMACVPSAYPTANTPTDWLKATVSDIHNGCIQAPKMDAEGTKQLNSELAVEQMELNIQLLGARTEQLQMQNWYVMQAGQVDPPPTEELLDEANKLAHQLESELAEQGIAVMSPNSLQEMIECELDSQGNLRSYRSL